MYITKQDIKRECGITFYNRGLNYFNDDRLSSIDIDDNDENLILLSTTIEGSRNNVYKTDISIQNVNTSLFESKIVINGSCTCPVGFNCKHVATSLIHYIELEQPADPQIPWLEKLAQSPELDEFYEPNKKEIILYFLSFPSHHDDLQVTMKKAHHKKNGTFTRLVNAPDSFSLRYQKNISETDKTLVRLIQSTSLSYYSEEYVVKDELGAYLLHKMIKSGHCYWQKVDKRPFKMGDKLSIEINWERNNQGEYKLKPLISSPTAQLVLTEPNMYIDIPNRTIGEVTKLDFTNEQLRTIIQSPSIKPSHIQNISKALALSYPNLSIPKPTFIQIQQIDAEGMFPSLDISQTSVGLSHFHIINFYFQYDNFRIPAFPQEEIVSIEENDTVFQIQRNLTEEEKYLQVLKDFGFTLNFDYGQSQSFFYSAANSVIESATRWHKFNEIEVPKLIDLGWVINYDDSFAMSFQEADDWYAGLEESNNNWFELRFDIEINGKKMPMVPLISEILNAYTIDSIPETIAVPMGEHNYVLLSKEQVNPVFQTLYELFNIEPTGDTFKISKFDALQLADLDAQHEKLQIKGAKKLIALGNKLRDFKGITKVNLPKGLKATLRDYQHTGVDWLQFLREYQLSGILADDMGLGKTVQVLSHLLIEKEQKRIKNPCLIIAPTSLMSNWRREIERFTPKLSVLVLQGPQRREHFKTIKKYDIILSTYPLLSRDSEILLKQQWYYVILDEAQMVKNPKSQASKVIRQINSEHRLCLTGTPMENHLGELWSLFDFLMPGFLADQKTFTTYYRTPIEKYGERDVSKKLSKRVKPFLLRRTKDEVLQDLPAKHEIIRSVAFEANQSKLYESIRISMEKKVRDAIAKNGFSRSHITILDALLKLRQVCCDPRLLKLSQAKQVKQSAKLKLLMDMLPEMIEEGRKVLLFSQFTSMLSLIEPELEKYKIPYSKLTGSTTKREQVIDEFKSGKTSVFLISLKAGGLGLNLTEADSVIIYDPWWNPAVEAQAADRTHRIGQRKSVFIYKLIVENSVEEKIVALQEKKQKLAQGIYGDGPSDSKSLFSSADIKNLFAPLESYSTKN